MGSGLPVTTCKYGLPLSSKNFPLNSLCRFNTAKCSPTTCTHSSHMAYIRYGMCHSCTRVASFVSSRRTYTTSLSSPSFGHMWSLPCTLSSRCLGCCLVEDDPLFDFSSEGDKWTQLWEGQKNSCRCELMRLPVSITNLSSASVSSFFFAPSSTPRDAQTPTSGPGPSLPIDPVSWTTRFFNPIGSRMAFQSSSVNEGMICTSSEPRVSFT
mmetsp:Transcript_27129/g.68143  ORF Transcript_27129/g.68143 Transcript_27129/m.68143 type:complete len:211 (+) Transcript_27129:508-1140(+)